MKGPVTAGGPRISWSSVLGNARSRAHSRMKRRSHGRLNADPSSVPLRKIEKITAIGPKHWLLDTPPYRSPDAALASLRNATPVEAIDMNARLNPKIGRRGILGLAAVGVAAVAASAALRERDVQEAEAKEQESKPRYRVTHDVEAFYRVNRY